MEKDPFLDAVSEFSGHLNTRLIMNPDGTIEPSEPSFDVSGINDYIKILIAREQNSIQRAFREGESHGYHEARKRHVPPLMGDFAFTNGKQNFIVQARGDYVEACEVKEGVMHSMQAITKMQAFEG